MTKTRRGAARTRPWSSRQRGKAARGVEALRRWSDGVEARWVGRWTEVEWRPATKTRGDLASIEMDTKSCALYAATRLVRGRGCARY
jgi:hypothetical protein